MKRTPKKPKPASLPTNFQWDRCKRICREHARYNAQDSNDGSQNRGDGGQDLALGRERGGKGRALGHGRGGQGRARVQGRDGQGVYRGHGRGKRLKISITI